MQKYPKRQRTPPQEVMISQVAKQLGFKINLDSQIKALQKIQKKS